MLLVLSGFLHSSEDFVDYTIIFFFMFCQRLASGQGTPKFLGAGECRMFCQGWEHAQGLLNPHPWLDFQETSPEDRSSRELGLLFVVVHRLLTEVGSMRMR